MKRFVFRAQPALDLRHRQEDDAKRALAIAEGREIDARATLEEAERLLEDMLQRGGSDEASRDLTLGLWYRNWLVGHRQQIARCRTALAERRKAVAEAARHAQLARRQSRSLELVREHAWQRYTREEARQEQKVLDELGAMRFALRQFQAGGNT